jgi:hypothetical protein
MKETRDKTTGELRIELRRLRETVHDLADAVEELADGQGNGKGDSPPENAQAAKNRAQAAREKTGPPVPSSETIRPPWKREGFETKEQWRESKE